MTIVSLEEKLIMLDNKILVNAMLVSNACHGAFRKERLETGL